MRPSTFLRNLSTKLSLSQPSSIAPWPPACSPFDRWLTSELNHLRVHPNLYATAAWLADSLDLAIASQRMARNAISSSSSSRVDIGKEHHIKRLIEEDSSYTLELLDACSGIRRRIEEIRAYMSSVMIALHWLEPVANTSSTSHVALERAESALESCEAMERRCPELECSTRVSSLRKLGEQKIMNNASNTKASSGKKTEQHEIVAGSRSVALLVVSLASIALSFRTRRGILQSSLSSSSKAVGGGGGGGSSNNRWWRREVVELQREAKEEYGRRRREGAGVVLEELASVVSGAQRLRQSLVANQREVGGGVEKKNDVMMMKLAARELKMRCRELEERVKPLEDKVEGLYKGLLHLRMCMLGVLSHS